jgi:hypothetical protein
MSGADLDVETREAYLAAHEPLGEDSAVAEERYRALVTSDPGRAILDLYGATEAAVGAVLSAHTVETPAPDSDSRVPRELPSDLLDARPRRDWIRAQRASLAALQILVEEATMETSLDLPRTAFPASRRPESAVVLPLCIGPTGNLYWIDIEYAAATLPSSLQPGPETEAAFRAAGFDASSSVAPVVVANTARLCPESSTGPLTQERRDLTRLARMSLNTLCPGTARDPTRLLVSGGSVDVDGMQLG